MAAWPSALSPLKYLLHPRPLVANASKFPEWFRGLFAVSGDIRNRDYSRVNGWKTPKWEYRQ
jgi:hypothetical protein